MYIDHQASLMLLLIEQFVLIKEDDAEVFVLQ